MKENKTIFDYIARVMSLYGVMIALNIPFISVFGETAKDYSSFFSLGSAGMPFDVLISFLLMSIIITIIQVLFLSDILIKNMKLTTRNILFFASITIISLGFIVICKWFPVSDFTAWVGFVCSYFICAVVGIGVDRLKEKTENRKMEEALQKIQNSK